jgi:hypothetical protein
MKPPERDLGPTKNQLRTSYDGYILLPHASMNLI